MEIACCHCRAPFLKEDEPWYGLHKKCFQECFGLSRLIEFSDLVARSQSHAPQEERKTANISFFHGAYRKYSARLEEASYILKVRQEEYPELPATEFLCNQIFESLGIPVPKHYLVKFPEDHLCFVTKNFMSGLINSDLVHIYHFMPDGANYNCEYLVNVIGEQTGRRIEQEKFVSLTLADSLIGNHDRHGRNLGFIRSPKGMILAPFYDNPSGLALEGPSMLGADLRPRGSIFTRESNKPTMKDYVREWERLGYSEVTDQFRKNLSLKKIEGLIQHSHLTEKRKNALFRLIQKRSQELC